ncbi:MAG: hypothetical protein U5L76_04735 [Patescibacteria group bacterium]|nr:hypothetical protein [Patescibacteria group bacterium]
MKIFYREIIKKAWTTTKKLKFLWFFGIFASLTANGEEYDIIIRNIDTVTNLERVIKNLRNTLNEGVFSIVSENLNTFFTKNVFSSILVVLVGIIIAAAAVYLITISQVAIISAAHRFKKKKSVAFLDGFFIGTKKFWPILIINLIAKAIIYGLLLVIGIPLAISYVNSGSTGTLTTLSVFAFIILIPLNIFISFLVRYATINVILNGEKIKASIKTSFHLFRKNWLITLENAILLYVINFVITFVIVSVLTFLSLPFTAWGYAIFMAIIIFVGSLIATFRFSVWTYLFESISKGEGLSKILRIFQRKKPKEISE